MNIIHERKETCEQELRAQWELAVANREKLLAAWERITERAERAPGKVTARVTRIRGGVMTRHDFSPLPGHR